MIHFVPIRLQLALQRTNPMPLLSPFPSRRHCGFTAGIMLRFAGIILMSTVATQTFASDPAPAFIWERLPDLPDPIGLKGMYAGVSHGHILLAGGSNFPVPNREGGAKTFARNILVRPADAAPGVEWRVIEQKLPVGQSEGSSVTTESGVVLIGGQGATGARDGVFLLSWDEATSSIRRQKLPALPQACANTAAVCHDGSVYVAGGDFRGRGLAQFLRLDLAKAMSHPDDASWEVLPSWPGPPRFGAALSALRVDGREQLVLFGGRVKAMAPAALADYLDDGYCFDPSEQSWHALAPMPHPALLAAAVRIDASRLAIMGGSDGHDLERMAELGDRYRLPDRIVVYDAGEDRWREAGTMPVGAVGVAVAALDHGWLLAGGEYSPGLRTPRTYCVAVEGEASR